MRNPAAPLALLVASCLSTSAHATPSEAAALGALDAFTGANLDTYQYLDNDLNIFTNPALAHQYADQVQINLGYAGGGQWEGTGINPRGHALIALNDDVTIGLVLNRQPTELGESVALNNVLANNLAGSGGRLQGNFMDPLSNAGFGAADNAVGLSPPLDLMAAANLGSIVVGGNLYTAFGQTGSDSASDTGAGWTRNRSAKRSSWTTLTLGMAGNGPEDRIRPEAWVRYTGVSAWSDNQSWTSVERDEWTTDEITLDRTVGLRGTSRIGGGFRAVIPGEKVDLIPLVIVDFASGSTFGSDRMFNDETVLSETQVVRAEDDLFAARSLVVRGGMGWRLRATDDLTVLGSVHGSLNQATSIVDNQADVLSLPNTTKNRMVSSGSSLSLPILSIAGEYFPYENLGLRGGVRAPALMHANFGRNSVVSGPESDSFATEESFDGFGGGSQGNIPALTSAFGPSIVMGDATIDAVVGGLFVGSGGDLFGRVDVKMEW